MQKYVASRLQITASRLPVIAVANCVAFSTSMTISRIYVEGMKRASHN